MLSSQPDIEQLTQQLTYLCGEQYSWRWEAEKKLLLCEFASNKKEAALAVLSDYFEHQWHTKNIAELPEQVKIELGEFSTVKGEQMIFSSSSEYKLSCHIVAFWWPWGHGGTISLRLGILEKPYRHEDIKIRPVGYLNWFKQIFLSLKPATD